MAFSTDFKSEADYIKATNKGYFSTKDYKAGEKDGFSNGPHFYFARQIGLDATQSLEALDLGLGDLDDYQFLKKGNSRPENKHRMQEIKDLSSRKKVSEGNGNGMQLKRPIFGNRQNTAGKVFPRSWKLKTLDLSQMRQSCMILSMKPVITRDTMTLFSRIMIFKHLTSCAITGLWWTSSMKLDMINYGKQSS